MTSIDLRLGDCLSVLPTLPDSSADLILTDPPYFRVKSEAWDRQWGTKDGFLAWLGDVLREFRRVLKPNGSLYVFASPQMAARVEVLTGEFFHVLNCIRWEKPRDNSERRHRAQLVDKGLCRSFYPSGERIIFAEQYGADSMALGESGYAAQCETLRGFVFEPLRAYLAGEFAKAGWRGDDLNRICGTASMAARHYVARSQWCLPTAEHYAKLQAAALAGVLRREYEDLRREYEDLRREYEDLRRPFSVSAAVPYSDVWDFPTVKPYPGKHPCEKPQALLRHMIEASSRPGALVLDAFAGTASTALACLATGRDFLGIEKSPEYHAHGLRRIADAQAQLSLTA